MPKELKGIIPPLITVFDSEGHLDEKKYRDLIEFQCKHVQGLFVCGTYGSGPMMINEERKKVLEVALDQVNGRIPVIAHVGSSKPDEILELALHAEKAGVDAIATVPPFYYGYSQDDIVRFYEWIIKHVNIPLYLYDNPKTTGLEIEIATLKRLKEVGLTGIKDSTFDLIYFYEIKNNLGFEDFNYISGTEAYIVPSIPVGASAAICGLANAFPEIVVELYNKTINKEYEEAFVLQEKVNHLREIQHFASSIPAIHAMLRLRGIDGGFPKKPFVKVSEEIYQKIRNAVIETGYVDIK